MTNKLRSGKKILAIALVFTWLVSLVPMVHAATLTGGDLIKASGAAVYYYGSDGKRYVFPNEKTFSTWYSDFSSVKTITDGELANIAIGGNVVYRSGTKLIKITTDPKVYAVEPGGVLRWVKTEEIAKALYGNNWAQRVDDVGDSYFTNYTIGSPVEAAIPPKGSVVSDGTNSYYINASGQKQMLDVAGKAANMIRNEFILNLSSTELASFVAGVALGAKDSSITDAAQTGSTGNNGTGVALTGDVTVSLSASSPLSGSSLPDGSSYAKVLCLDIKNAANMEVKLQGLSVRRTGILADSSVTGVMVTDVDGVLHGTTVTFGESLATSSFISEPISILSGQTALACVNVNLSSSLNTGTLGMQVLAAADVNLVSSSGQAVTAKGLFPIVSATQSIVDGAGALGAVTVSARTVAGGVTATPTEVDQGVKNLDVAKFRLQETTGNEAVEVMNINFNNNGSATDNDVENIRLLDQNNNTVAVLDQMVANELKFVVKGLTASGVSATEIGPNGGYLIPAGQLRDFTLRVDTKSGTNSAARTLNFVIQTTDELRLMGTETGVGVTPAELGGNAWDSFPIGSAYNVVEFKAGTISVSRSTASLSGKISKGATDVVLATYDISAFGEDVEVQSISYVIRASSATGLIEGNYALSGTVKIQNASGANVYSQTATDANHYGTGTSTVASNIIATANTNGTATLKTLNSYYTIKAGETGQIRFVADIHQSATAADSYTVVISGYKIRRLSSNNYVTNAAITVASNTLTVDSSTISVVENSSFNPINLVKGGLSQKIGSFNLQAGSAEGQRVNAIKVKVCGHTTTPVTLAACAATTTTATGLAAISNISLKVGDVLKAEPFTVSTVAGYTASVSNLTVPASQTVTVDVYGIVSSAFTAHTNIGVGLTVTSAVGIDSQTTTTLDEVYGKGIIALTGGTLDVTAVSDTRINVNKLLHANETDVEIYKFQIKETANAEDMIVNKIFLGVKGATANLTNFKLLRLSSPAAQVGTTATLNNNEVQFTGLTETIPKGGIINYIVKASTNTTGSLDLTNNAGFVGVTYMEQIGKTSGVQTIHSGGMMTSVANATDLVTVANISNFENGDAIRIDWNNDGDYLDDHSAGGVTLNENTVQYACSRAATTGSAGTIKLYTTSDCSTTQTVWSATEDALFVANGRASKFAVSSNAFTVHESEPVIALHANSGNTSNHRTNTDELSSYVIAANGARPITFNSFSVELSGAWDVNSTNGTYGPMDFRMYAGDSVSGASNDTRLDSAGPTLEFAPSGVAGCLVNDATAQAKGETAIPYDTCTANQGFRVGDRVYFGTGAACVTTTTDDNSGLGYRVTAFTGTTSGTITVTPSVRTAATIVDNNVICGVSQGATTVNDATVTAGETSLTLTAVTNINEGDLITFSHTTSGLDSNSGLGYRITDITGLVVTVSPALPVITNGALALSDGIVIDATDVLEPGAILRFAPASTEEIPANDSKVYVFTARTNSMDDPNVQGGTQSISMSLNGTKGTLTANAGFNWGYTDPNNTLYDQLRLSDSYTVNSTTILYYN